MIRVCDFCASNDPVWRYPTLTAVKPGEGHRIWHACRTCHELIEDGAWLDLAVRARALFFHQSPLLRGKVDPEMMLEFLLFVHRQFAKRRNGPPIRL